MNKIALFIDRAYIETQPCYMEPAIQLAKHGFQVDLYMPFRSNNHQPFFENQAITVYPFPDSGFQKGEFWSKVLYARDRRYKAVVGTPIRGSWIAYRTAKIQRIPYYYFADELLESQLKNVQGEQKKKLIQQNYLSNKNAIASIVLGEDRYLMQKMQNKIDYPHEYIVIPNAQSGPSHKLKSNYFRDIFNIEDRKPILLFAGTLNWNLAKRVFEETKDYSERDFHIVFQSRTVGMMTEEPHPFIKMSTIPIPSSMMNYVVSSADIGLALYDKHSESETNNGITGGKIGTYLKNGLPVIAGSSENLKLFEEKGVGVYWDGETFFDEIAMKGMKNIDSCKKNIPGFYRENLQYEYFFEKFVRHLMRSIKQS